MPAIWVQGELSGFVHHSSGHFYFSLKDKDAQIACVMWRSRTLGLTFTPQNGMKINVFGSVRVYEKRGAYQLDVIRMAPAGIGDLQLMYEALKEKLYKEGLFDVSRKKLLPEFPERIGIVTSLTGAAIRDILQVLNRRFPAVVKILRPTLVQGEGAAEDIARAIQDFNDYQNVDVLIIGRGGGSLQDLWAFNEEKVARAIFSSTIPTISAVGHEIDYTISDFVADRRAPTPSAAAELVVPVASDLKKTIHRLHRRCRTSLPTHITLRREKLARLQKSYAFRRPLDLILEYKQGIDDRFHLIQMSAHHSLSKNREKLSACDKRIKAAHPRTILQRGYAIVSKDRTHKIVRNAAELEQNEKLNVYLGKGSFTSTAETIREDDSFACSAAGTEKR